MTREREYKFTDKDFNIIRDLVTKNTGIVLADHKRDMVYGRLSRRLRQLNLVSFKDYCDLVRSDHDDELIELVNAITTNLTSFFREMHHFTHLSKTVMPMLLKRNEQTRRIRIWSAGCSTGEEPYSIAMAVREVMPSVGWDIRILATDLDTNVVNTAKRGVYNEDRIQGIEQGRMRRWFKRGSGQHAGSVRVSPMLQEMITFKQLNLLHEWPIKGPFDVIFCRNVVIYFDKETQRMLFDRYANLMHESSTLYIGHSESLFNVTDRLKLIGQTTYHKVY